MNRYIFPVALAFILLAGCSTSNTKNAAAADDDEKTVVTGSRIPRSDRNAAGLKSTGDSNAIKDMMRPNPGGGMPGS